MNETEDMNQKLYKRKPKNNRLFFHGSKRFIDIVGGFMGMTIFAIPMIIIGTAIYINDRGSSPMFLQERVGKDGEKFKIFKFRTMITSAEDILFSDKFLYEEFKKNGYKFPEGKDPRVTKIGDLLRKTSMDEIPQFLNVLNGSMSLVGPRPVVEKELEEYGEKKEIFLSVKPGVTGLWQVSGRSEVGYPERCDLELEYVHTQCLSTDLKILFRTFTSVIMRKGAF